ncbi:MAG: hypothetical protein ACM3UN_02640 [Bacillota bacterium]
MLKKRLELGDVKMAKPLFGLIQLRIYNENATINKQVSGLCDLGTVAFSNCITKVSNVEGKIGIFLILEYIRKTR